FLEKEVAPFADWVIWQALASPKLEVRESRVEPAGTGAWRLRVAVQNTGWLPTNVTKSALKNKLCRGVVAEIGRAGEAHGGAGSSVPGWLVSGKLRQEEGQLVGWDHIATSGFGWHMDDTSDVAVFEWVVSKAGEYEVEVHHERAGRVRTTLRVA
ncbi:MAG TPA: hypothetical protein VKT78_19730, partial [Fimbriimonadaceae bacterium]|nr:hypothetical protein [Fimbriimonadaceae bacterium]